MPGSVIAGDARTPIGKLSGALKGFVDLRGIASTSLLLRIADRRYLRAALPRLRIANDLTAGGIDLAGVPDFLALPNVACVGGLVDHPEGRRGRGRLGPDRDAGPRGCAARHNLSPLTMSCRRQGIPRLWT